MADLEIKRHFTAPPDRVFAFISEADHLSKWWGPEGIELGEHDLDFSKPGPWGSVMLGSEGARYKVTGEVLSVEPGKSVTFTWAWHDDDDQRGAESEVTFSVADDGNGGTEFVMLHRGLPDDDSASNHDSGWTSSFQKLEAYAREQNG